MEEKMQQNREMILLSARELVAQGGFKDAQIQAIADRAGVSSGLVYRYFENKNQLYKIRLSVLYILPMQLCKFYCQNYFCNFELKNK